jgi:NAD(P)-dependent dehydrogenase (short-subunit alcohol dehydrogenase family)
MAMELQGKTAVVTGAGTGVGRELACEFARAGAKVACCGRREALLAQTVGRIEMEGGTALAIQTDVTDRAQVEQMVARTLAEFGRIDLLFNNAGSFRSVAPVWEVVPETWWRDVTTNLYGSLLCCRAVLPHMRARNSGIIVNMDGGGGAHGPNLAGSGYGCSKAALLRFTEGLARELELDGSAVLVFCINPGFVRTEMTESIVSTPTGVKWQGFVQEWIEKGIGKQPWECARATMKLLAIAGPELNGCVFDVDTDFDQVARRRQEIRQKRLLTLRLRRD